MASEARPTDALALLRSAMATLKVAATMTYPAKLGGRDAPIGQGVSCYLGGTDNGAERVSGVDAGGTGVRSAHFA